MAKLDTNFLLLKLKDQDLSKETGNTQSLSISDILDKMALAKTISKTKSLPTFTRVEHQTLPRQRPPSRLKSPIRRDLGDRSISQFRQEEPRWFSGSTPDSELINQLYRVPQFDCSGKRIQSVERDEAKDKIWYAVNTDINIPKEPPAPRSTTPYLRKQIPQDMDRTIRRVEEEVESMPEFTERMRRLKDQACSQLFEMKRSKENLLMSFSRPISRNSSTNSLRSVSPQTISRPGTCKTNEIISISGNKSTYG